MTLNLQLPTQELTMRPVITVVGVGGAGGNAVNNMISAQLEGVQFVVANTDAQALESALTDRTIQLGRTITQGLGAGATPEIGQAAAEETADEILQCIEGSHMVFITAGMGGGTGTGAAPVVARMAREQGMLTVGVVTKPFQFEGGRRMTIAEQGIAELQKYVDTLIIIPNQNLFRVANEKTTFADAFRMADEVLHSGVRGVTDLMVKPGLVNLDFADIRTVMQEMGKAMMGTGEASGEKRAIEAAEAAISNPLLDDVSLKGAKAALINITGGTDMTLYEVDEAANRIREEIDTDANIIFGSTFNESMQGLMRVSVVATGIDGENMQQLDTAMGGAARNFTKPSAAKQPSFKPTSTYYVGRKPAQTATHAANPLTQAGVVRRDNATTEQKMQENVEEVTRQPRPAMPAMPTREAGFKMQSQQAPRFDSQQSRQLHQRHQPATPVAPQQQVQPVAEQQAFDEEDAGPLFVSPKDAKPASRQFQSFEPQAAEDENANSSFKIFSKIADVSRSFNSGRAEAPQQPSATRVEVRETQEHYAEEESFEDYKDHEEDSYYDIPAFLRRQNT